MPCGNKGCAKGGCFVPEIAEFQFLVAHDAGIGSAAGLVLVSEVIDHQALEGNRFVDHIVRNSQCMGDTAGIGDGLGAAALVLRTGHAVLRPEFHGDSDDLPSLLFQQVGRDAGVNASAHPHNDATGFG